MQERTFGGTFKSLRIYRKMLPTQKALIKDFYDTYGIKLTKSAVSQYESNKRIPETPLLMKFADYFDTTIDYLLCRSEHEIKDIRTSINNLYELIETLSEEDRKEALKYMNYLKTQREGKEGE